MGISNGAAPVATLDALPAGEARLVMAMRRLGDGEAPLAVWERRLVEFLGLVATTARRPVLTHSTGCGCVGADEAVLAHLVATAATGDREDAMLIAVLLVRADAAPLVVSLAETLGLMLRRAGDPASETAPRVVH